MKQKGAEGVKEMLQVCLATERGVRHVAALARVLGPLRMMPNVRQNTVLKVDALAQVVDDLKGGATLDYR